jgi:hypothetical protein
MNGRDQHRAIIMMRALNTIATNLIVVFLSTCHNICINNNNNNSLVVGLALSSHTRRYAGSSSQTSIRHISPMETAKTADNLVYPNTFCPTEKLGQGLSPPIRPSLALRQSNHKDDDDDNNNNNNTNNRSTKTSLGDEERKPTQKSKSIQFLRMYMSSFVHGANTVHSSFLDIFWKYSIVQSLLVTLPFGLLLWLSRLYVPSVGQQVYDVFYYPLYSLWIASARIAHILHWPLERVLWITSRLPVLVITAVEYLPSVLAVPMVQAILVVNDAVTRVAVRFTPKNNNFSPSCRRF